MLNRLSIQDFAIIETLSLDFHQGFHIVTGETGAGKSILIEAISLALGSRADTTLIRSGCAKATVELTVSVEDAMIDQMLIENDLEPEAILRIFREIQAGGKSLCRINGAPVSVTFLNRLCKRIADIHGQYDHQSLLDPENHIHLVDDYDKISIAPLKEAVASRYRQFIATKRLIAELKDGAAARERMLDFKRFEFDEIEKAQIQPEEDLQLEQRLQILKNLELISQSLSEAYRLVYEDSDAAIDRLRKGSKRMEEIAPYSDEYAILRTSLDECYYRLEDMQNELRNMRDAIDGSSETMDPIIERLDLLDKLKRKHGGSLEKVLQYRDSLRIDLQDIERKDLALTDLELELTEHADALKQSCDLLTVARKQAATRLEKEIERELKELNFKDAAFTIAFHEPSESSGPIFSEDGADRIEFLLVTNLGESPKPLAKIASGGEISRIMLAIKTILGDYDRIPTLIFDEIDSGISGITASIVGKKLKGIAENHQVICITHLPQIAAYSDRHYQIYKEAINDRVTTKISLLDPAAKRVEIARLLGGMTITETTLRNAEELIAQSNG
jgi:DNA repair protein RecN (Recombination protein N)